LRDQCSAGHVAFFFKQWGGVRKKVAGRELDGRTHDAYPQRVTSAVKSETDRMAAAKGIRSEFGSLLPIFGD